MINKIMKIIENFLFFASLFVLLLWVLLAIFNVMEGWELPILVPLLYCVIKLKRISDDNKKVKEALKIGENTNE